MWIGKLMITFTTFYYPYFETKAMELNKIRKKIELKSTFLKIY